MTTKSYKGKHQEPDANAVIDAATRALFNRRADATSLVETLSVVDRQAPDAQAIAYRALQDD